MGRAAKLVLLIAALLALAGAAYAEGYPPSKPEAFGPAYLPDRVITGPEGFRCDASKASEIVHLLKDRDAALVVGTTRKANVWAFIVYFWPEIALVLLLIGLVRVTFRIRWIVRHPQAAGELLCRGCGYLLTGAKSQACPECGADLAKPRNIRRGRGLKRRLIFPLARGWVMLLCFLFLFFLWYPPIPPGGGDWGSGMYLSRYGAVSRWFTWHSAALARWTEDGSLKDIVRSYADPMDYVRLWEVDLLQGGFDQLRMDRELAEPDWRRNKTQIQHVGGKALIVEGAFRAFRYDPVTMSVIELKTDNPERRWGEIVGEFWQSSADGQYVFDSMRSPWMLGWDVTGQGKPIVGKLRVAEGTPRPVYGGSAVVVDTPGTRDRGYSSWIWNPKTNEFRQLETPLRDDTAIIAQSVDGRFFIAEKWDIINQKIQTRHVALLSTDKPDAWGGQGLNIQPPDGAATLFLSAVGKAKDTFYFYGPTRAIWVRWNVVTYETEIVPPPADADVAAWIRTPRSFTHPDLMVCPILPYKLEIQRKWDALEVETLTTPGPLYGGTDELWTDLDFDDRFIAARIDACVGVVYDRKTRKWIGRFDGSSHSAGGNTVSGVMMHKDRWLIMVIAEERVKLLVWDLMKHAGP